MADHIEQAAPWTIKGMPVEVREKAVRYARMEGVSVAEWMTRAVETQANRQDGNDVIAPAAPSERAAADAQLAMMAIGAANALAAMQTAGLPVTKVAARETVALVRDHVRAARGLPGLPTRQTRKIIGQTVNQDVDGSPDRLAAE